MLRHKKRDQGFKLALGKHHKAIQIQQHCNSFLSFLVTSVNEPTLSITSEIIPALLPSDKGAEAVFTILLFEVLEKFHLLVFENTGGSILSIGKLDRLCFFRPNLFV